MIIKKAKEMTPKRMNIRFLPMLYRTATSGTKSVNKKREYDDSKTKPSFRISI